LHFVALKSVAYLQSVLIFGGEVRSAANAGPPSLTTSNKHDPEKWSPVSEKIMLDQNARDRVRFQTDKAPGSGSSVWRLKEDHLKEDQRSISQA
jgi:hypothetical protein